jgi:hypothetical protein
VLLRGNAFGPLLSKTIGDDEMTVWTLSINGELDAIFDSEEKAIEARSQYLATGLENGHFTVASIRQWVLQ